MTTQRQPHAVGPREGHEHSHTVIFLHGRDSNNEEFASELFESEASDPNEQPRTLPDLFPSVRWVFPAAHILRSARFDTDMSQWFDMWSVEHPHEKPSLQEAGLKASVVAILDVVRSEETHLPREKIFLAGISQGFATAIAAFFADGRGGFAGLVGLSTWMPYGELNELSRLFGKHNSKGETGSGSTPVLLCHSSDDDVVPPENGRALRDILSQQSMNVEWHEYVDGGHWINEPRGVDDIVNFLKKYM